MMKVLSTDADFKAKVLLAPHHPADSVGEVVELADEMGDAAPAALPVGAAASASASGGAGGAAGSDHVGRKRRRVAEGDDGEED